MRSRSCLIGSWLIPVLLAGLPVTAPANPSIQTRPVHKRVLPNGLTILVREDPSAPVVSAQTWVSAGSITEENWLGAGLSHVLEHMLFKGTTTRGVAEIAHEIDAHGGYMNAYTTFERTVYYIDLPAEHWEIAVDILADCMMNATIPADELAKEKNVILREMAMNVDDPGRRASRLLWSTAYQVHPYRHPVIGYPDIYNHVTRDDVVAYYRRFYRPNNLIFSVVGDIDADTVIATIEKLTADWERGPLPPVYIPTEPTQLAPRRRDETMNVQLSQVSLAWHIPDFTHPDVYPLDVLAIILGQGRSSRLYRALQQDQGLVHSISSSSYTPAHPGLFIVQASVDPDQRDPAIAAVTAEIDRVLADGVTDDEVQKAIKVSTSHYLADLKTMKGQASDIAHSQLLLGDPDFSRQYLDRLRRVTADQVQNVARQYLVPHGLTVTSLNPVQETPTTDVAAEKQAAIQIQKFEFPNGLRLLVREDPRLPLVSLQALCRGGVLAETAANNGITRLTARMLLKGTTNRSADQIAEQIESVGGSISDFSGNNSFGLSAEVLSDDLALGLDILADVILHPAFPEDLLARERDTQVAEIKTEDDRILRVAQQLLRESMYQAHPYRLNPLGQTNTVAGLTRADLVAFHREHIRPDQLVLCVFGNVDAEQVRTMIAERFGSLEQVAPPAAAPTSGDILKADSRRTEHRPREQAVLLLGYNGTRMDAADRYPLEIIDAAYSGQGSRLYLRIREELGLAYYVGAYQLLGLDPGYIAFYIGTTPDKVDTCETELRAELARLATDGLPADELERAKSSLIGQQLVRRQDNSELAFTAGLDELYGLGYDFSFAATDRYRAVSEDDIKQVAQRYFGDAASAVVIVGPAMDQEQPAPAGAAPTEE